MAWHHVSWMAAAGGQGRADGAQSCSQRCAAQIRGSCLAGGPAVVGTAKLPSSESGVRRRPSRTHERRGERPVLPAAPGAGVSNPHAGGHASLCHAAGLCGGMRNCGSAACPRSTLVAGAWSPTG